MSDPFFMQRRGYRGDPNELGLIAAWDRVAAPWIIRVFIKDAASGRWSYTITNDSTGVVVECGVRNGFDDAEKAADSADAFLGVAVNLEKVVAEVRAALVQIGQSDLGKTDPNVHAVEDILGRIIDESLRAGLPFIPDGLPGIRDEHSPCTEFVPGKMKSMYARCNGDGHHLCDECRFYVLRED